MSESLPPELRARLDALVAKKPAVRELVDKLTAKHAAASSEKERQFIEKLLRDLVSPNRAGFKIGGAILLVSGLVVGLGYCSERKFEAALERSIPAVALVQRMEDGDCLVSTSRTRCLRLELEVHREGAAPYTGSLTHDIGLEWMSRVQPGSWLTIGVNPDDPNELLFDERAMAVAPPKPPTP